MRIHLNQKNLPLSRDLNIATLSDIHINHHFSSALSKKLLTSLKNKKLDAIFILGDFIDRVNVLESLEVKNLAVDFLKNLAKIAPVFMVYGNHDVTSKVHGVRSYEIPTDFRAELKKINNLTILDNEIKETKNFFVAGFTPSEKYYFSSKSRRLEPKNVLKRELEAFLSEKCANLPHTKPCFFLTHSPFHGDLLTEKLTDFDYIFTGHMHNGLLPRWLLWTTKNAGLIGPFKSRFPRFAHGMYKNLIILSPVNTLPSTFHFCQIFYPRYISLFNFKSDILKK